VLIAVFMPAPILAHRASSQDRMSLSLSWGSQIGRAIVSDCSILLWRGIRMLITRCDPSATLFFNLFVGSVDVVNQSM